MPIPMVSDVTVIIISAAAPVVGASADTYEIGSGPTIMLACTSLSDSIAAGTYEWKLGGIVEYVLSSTV